MTKKHFIALADAIREHNDSCKKFANREDVFTKYQIAVLADFCQQQNYQFNRERWLGYIAGTNGSNGGKVKQAA